MVRPTDARARRSLQIADGRVVAIPEIDRGPQDVAVLAREGDRWLVDELVGFLPSGVGIVDATPKGGCPLAYVCD